MPVRLISFGPLKTRFCPSSPKQPRYLAPEAESTTNFGPGATVSRVGFGATGVGVGGCLGGMPGLLMLCLNTVIAEQPPQATVIFPSQGVSQLVAMLVAGGFLPHTHSACKEVRRIGRQRWIGAQAREDFQPDNFECIRSCSFYIGIKQVTSIYFK